MKQVGFAPVLQKNSFFVLCLLGGIAMLSIADAKTFSTSNNGVVEKTVYEDNSDAIKKAVATMFAEAEDENTHVSDKEPFEKKAYYKKTEQASSRLTRLETEAQIRQEVALAMVSANNELNIVSTLSEDKLTELIRKEVVRALMTDKNHLPENRAKGELGWVYLGRFKDNKWLGSPLTIGSHMPEKGKKYTISGNVNIRKGSSAFQPVTHVLQANTNVQLTDIVKRGSKGHYWAKVSI